MIRLIKLFMIIFFISLNFILYVNEFNSCTIVSIIKKMCTYLLSIIIYFVKIPNTDNYLIKS